MAVSKVSSLDVADGWALAMEAKEDSMPSMRRVSTVNSLAGCRTSILPRRPAVAIGTKDGLAVNRQRNHGLERKILQHRRGDIVGDEAGPFLVFAFGDIRSIRTVAGNWCKIE